MVEIGQDSVRHCGGCPASPFLLQEQIAKSAVLEHRESRNSSRRQGGPGAGCLTDGDRLDCP